MSAISRRSSGSARGERRRRPAPDRRRRARRPASGSQRDARRRASSRRRWRRAAPPRRRVAAEACVSVSPPAETSCTRARSRRALRKASTAASAGSDLRGPAWKWTRATPSWRAAASRRAQKASPSQRRYDREQQIRRSRASTAAAQLARARGARVASAARRPRIELDDAGGAQQLRAARRLGPPPSSAAACRGSSRTTRSRGVRQQRCRVRAGSLSASTHHQRARADVGGRVGRGDRLEVGALHASTPSAKGSGPTMIGRSSRTRAQRRQALPVAGRGRAPPGCLRTMSQAVENSSRRPSLAGCVMAACEKYERQKPWCQAAPTRERLAAEALLEQLVDVEGGDLELRDGARRPRVGAQEELAAAARGRAPRTPSSSRPARPQQVRRAARRRALAVARRAALSRVDDAA